VGIGPGHSGIVFVLNTGSALSARIFKEAHEIDFCECGTLRRLQDMRDRLRSKPFLSIAAASGGYL
jgi:predicted PhzF superfamily epimerase YddE/YHI9